VPRSFDELADAMRGFAAFAICFALLLYYWYEHAKFFRRYGLQDTLTVVLNGAFPPPAGSLGRQGGPGKVIWLRGAARPNGTGDR
jgi:hypothetical protein